MGRDLGAAFPQVYISSIKKTIDWPANLLAAVSGISAALMKASIATYSLVKYGWAPSLLKSFSTLASSHKALSAIVSVKPLAMLFASKAWTDRDAMLERMLSTDLFDTDIGGPCTSVREAWQLGR